MNKHQFETQRQLEDRLHNHDQNAKSAGGFWSFVVFTVLGYSIEYFIPWKGYFLLGGIGIGILSWITAKISNFQANYNHRLNQNAEEYFYRKYRNSDHE